MQVTTLKDPGSVLGQTIRKEVARAISQLEDAAVYGTPDAALSAFLYDAASKTPGFAGPVGAGTKAVVTSGVKVNAVSVTGTGNFATFTVVNGAITAIVLSAS
jgi:hypothetical protein